MRGLSGPRGADRSRGSLEAPAGSLRAPRDDATMRAGVRPRRVRDVSAPVRSAHLHLRALALERRRHRARPAGSSRRLWARDALRAAREPGRLRREARRTSSYRPAGHWRRSARPFFSALSAATRERISARRAEALTPCSTDRDVRGGGCLPPRIRSTRAPLRAARAFAPGSPPCPRFRRRRSMICSRGWTTRATSRVRPRARSPGSFRPRERPLLRPRTPRRLDRLFRDRPDPIGRANPRASRLRRVGRVPSLASRLAPPSSASSPP